MTAYWPNKIPKIYADAGGRASGKDGDQTLAAQAFGRISDADCTLDAPMALKIACGQVLHISLFFDGTNNHLDWDCPRKVGETQSFCDLEQDHTFPENIPPPKTDDAATHSNIARLYRACPQDNKRTHSIYIPGVGTPFPAVGEPLFWGDGKAYADGFQARICFAYLELLERIYQSMGVPVLSPDIAKLKQTVSRLFNKEALVALCQHMQPVNSSEMVRSVPGGNAGYSQIRPSNANEHPSQVIARLITQEHTLASMSRDLRGKQDPKGKLCGIKYVYLNVFGFSRGAAAARVFSNILLKHWAPNGKICDAIYYRINFLGLFDTVASVGKAESFNYASSPTRGLGSFDGHNGWCSSDNLRINEKVHCCRHFFSLHEQRASFPLDSIAHKGMYPPINCKEVAYPGVHSDIGGGYPTGDQGKSLAGHRELLSKIPLHDMYIEALKSGVLLLAGEELANQPKSTADLALSASTIDAFNAWLGTRAGKTVSITEALTTGFYESLAWRFSRNQPHDDAQYITRQAFFGAAQQDKILPEQLDARLNAALKADTTLQAKFLAKIMARHKVAGASAAMKEEAESRRKSVLLDQVAQEAGLKGRRSRPGEDAWDLLCNDKSDLVEAAQDFQLLLCNVIKAGAYRDKNNWGCIYKVDFSGDALEGASTTMNAWIIERDPRYTVCQDGSVPKKGTPRILRTSEGAYLADALAASIIKSDAGDVFFAPTSSTVINFINALPERLSSKESYRLKARMTHLAGLIPLFDGFVHDSRAWFRVPRHHELTPGGYGFARVCFQGAQKNQDYVQIGSIKDDD